MVAGFQSSRIGINYTLPCEVDIFFSFVRRAHFTLSEMITQVFLTGYKQLLIRFQTGNPGMETFLEPLMCVIVKVSI